MRRVTVVVGILTLAVVVNLLLALRDYRAIIVQMQQGVNSCNKPQRVFDKQKKMT